jgi:hypothetical protein
MMWLRAVRTSGEFWMYHCQEWEGATTFPLPDLVAGSDLLLCDSSMLSHDGVGDVLRHILDQCVRGREIRC